MWILVIRIRLLKSLYWHFKAHVACHCMPWYIASRKTGRKLFKTLSFLLLENFKFVWGPNDWTHTFISWLQITGNSPLFFWKTLQRDCRSCVLISQQALWNVYTLFQYEDIPLLFPGVFNHSLTDSQTHWALSSVGRMSLKSNTRL